MISLKDYCIHKGNIIHLTKMQPTALRKISLPYLEYLNELHAIMDRNDAISFTVEETGEKFYRTEVGNVLCYYYRYAREEGLTGRELLTCVIKNSRRIYLKAKKMLSELETE